MAKDNITSSEENKEYLDNNSANEIYSHAENFHGEQTKSQPEDEKFSIKSLANLKSLIMSACFCLLFILVSICFAIEMNKFAEIENSIVSIICLCIFIISLIVAIVYFSFCVISIVMNIKNYLKCKKNDKEV